MASVFKRGRWVDASGRKCRKGTPGAKRVKSDTWMIRIYYNGKPKLIEGFTDKGATVAKANDLERRKAKGEADLIDPFEAHRKRPLAEHVADWIGELKQLGRDHVYIGQCEFRMGRMIQECGWKTLDTIGVESFIRWRTTATAKVGTSHEPGANIGPMSARTQNHYLTTAVTFARWAVKRKRVASHPLAEISKVDTAGKLKRQRRALTEDEVAALLAVVPARHQLAYRMILSTGLRRDELKQLQWGDVKMNAPMPHIQLRAETTKAKRADALPLRADLVELLKAHRGETGDSERVLRAIPNMEGHKRYLERAGIAYLDDRNRRVDFHSLRHTYGSLLAKAGVAPRVAMSLMRHTDMRLTMNVYTDPRIFDMAGAVEKLTALAPEQAAAVVATGTDGSLSVTGSVTGSSAQIGYCAASIGNGGEPRGASLSLANGGDRQQKTLSGGDRVNRAGEGTRTLNS